MYKAIAMTHFRPMLAVAVSALALSAAGTASAQNSAQEQFGQILGALLGQVNSVDAQWSRGARPLNAARAQFYARVDADVRSRALTSYEGTQLKRDYDGLVALETSYAADGRFSTQERADLNARYNALTRSYADRGPGGYQDQYRDDRSIAEGAADFEARVAEALAAREITRAEATRLRSDYAGLVSLEAGYARGGIDAREQADLDARLAGLEDRLGYDPRGGPTPGLDPRTRLVELEAMVRANERNGQLTRAEATEIRVQYGDLVRLEAAYGRLRPTAEENAYLLRRIGELEIRARGYRR